ncbi:uncharacterized protein F5147DRAFT_686586 [Suillus discolor]|uniref:RNA polymerase II elongation factor ELL N-terminal domain-containing protein n=1 Tax=Suillus discolor TaxID=1912936 RepID=A0A9P7JW18_9AGAM|nr:uncharacterized protein F5147DRAFT_686586 [Suillus discolor]KAG2111164.1 hypothetical protein F5147DRAFT_686586 [Suillus discolor]
MPLPSGTPLSLQGHSRPGDTVQTKPKHAMIVRMSAETLEALEDLSSNPLMNFEFGDTPGIYIGGTFFPMRPLKESSPHEIYLRTSSAAKPNAPLKLYANVMGKFIVDRQLGEKVTDKVRQQTIEAKKQHSERQTIMLDAPLISAAGTKNLKRKTPGSGTVVKKSAQRDTLHTPAASTPAARKISPIPQTVSSKANADIRRRLIHFLAVENRETDLTVARVCGSNCDASARANLLSILEEVAEQAPARKGDKSPRKWGLKNRTWLEVRPYEWEMYKPSDRTNIARQGRVVLSSLRIPESDSVWDHFRFRNVAPPTGAPPHPTHGGKTITGPPAGLLKPKPEPKRPAISKDLKQKAKADSSRIRGDIQMKDESARPRGDIQMKDESVKLPRVAAIKREEASPSPSSSTSTSSKAASRRLPGSGYVAKKSPQPSPTVESASRGAAGPADVRPQRPLPRLPPKPVPASLPPLPSQEKTSTTSMPMKMTKKMLPPEDSDRERERHRDKDRPQKDRVVAGGKRKNATHDVGDAQDGEGLKANSFKKRKTEDGPSSAASSSSLKGRDLSLPKKPVEATSPVPPPPKKIKKESSPLPPPRTALPTQPPPLNSPSKTDQRPKLNGASKVRRKSPIYTSSDEGEIPEPPQKSAQDPSTNTDRAKGKEGRARPRSSYPLPSDRNGLRSRYQSKYGHYLGTYAQILAQKRKIEAILNGESEAEGEIMDPEELKRLSAEHKNQKEELESIQDKWMNGSVSE